MTEARIRIEGIEPLLKKITTLRQLRPVRAAIRSSALYVKGRVARYPPQRHGPQPFETDRQRRGFFAKLRSGEIEVPYRRGISPGSQALGRSWSIGYRKSGLRAVLTNRAGYGPLVQDREKQAAYHKATGWPTTQGVMEAEEATVVEVVRRALQRVIDAGG